MIFGLGCGFILALLTFYLVITKFDSRIWIAGISSLVVLAFCGFNGFFGVIVCALALGAMFKADF